MSTRNLITPVDEPSGPINSQQIQQLISNSNEKDMLFYEYEIVDKDKEARWANKEARKYGLCLCSRWLFLMLGNLILVLLTCSTCAILLYVNTPNDETVQPLTYGQSCTTNSNNCDSLRYLVCSSSVCSCYSNRVWNGTDCACSSGYYWDGLACLQNQGYQQPCASWLPCYSQFTCDSSTSTCLCPSTSTSYYTQYYTGAVTDLYSGSCVNKGTIGQGCATYGVKSCQEWSGLTCSYTAALVYLCQCYSGYYWHDTNKVCTAQVMVSGGSCTGNSTSACATNTSLVCTSGTCQCPSTYFWHPTNLVCTLRGGYMSACNDVTWCNTTLSLICPTTSGAATCNCPTTSAANKCDCTPTTHYWDGQTCSPRVGLNSPCAYQSACSTGTCLYGYCL